METLCTILFIHTKLANFVMEDVNIQSQINLTNIILKLFNWF